MSCQDPRGAGDSPVSPTQAEDDSDQAAVLAYVLALHPTHLSVEDLVRGASAGATEFEGTDRIERAVRDLVAAGLLHSASGLVTPTRAALRAYALLEG
jgi:hypothetical protein